MNRDIYINEETRPQRLPVWFVPQLENKIDEIYGYNIKSNRNNTIQWFQDIEEVKQHISERVIGLQYYRGPKTRWRMPQNILGFNVFFSKKDTDVNSYICVYNMELNLNTYGLKDPSTIQESKAKTIVLKESQLREIIQETIKKLLRA